MINTFKATHCGQTFEGAEGASQLEAHMKAEHDRRKLVPGSDINKERRAMLASRWGVGTAPGWARGEIQKPTPWVAPKPSRGGLDKVTADLEAGKYYWPVGTWFPAGVRWSTANSAGERVA